MDESENAQEALRQLRRRLLGGGGEQGLSEGRHRIKVEGVELEDRDDGKVVVILFRAEERPGCVFGFEMDAVEPLEGAGDEQRMFADPREWAAIILVNLDERLCAQQLGLPENCEQGTVTWL